MEELTNNAPTVLGEKPELSADVKKQIKLFKQGVESCKQYRRKLVKDWQVNVDYRRGKPFAGVSDEDRVSVPLDWSLTKGKESQLFSQVPAVRINHPPHTTSGPALTWVHSFETYINDQIIEAGVESTMGEALPDCINAAGIGVVVVARQAITRDVMLPAPDLQTLSEEDQAIIAETQLMPDGSPIPMEPTSKVLDSKYSVSRISPADFLWPLSFTGSDFDLAPWVGRSGRAPWPEALRLFHLDPSEKDKMVGETRNPLDRIERISQDTLDKNDITDESVSFDEIFYKEFLYNPDATSYAAIHHLVFVEGKDEPVINEPWQGQQIDKESGTVLGSQKFPIRVLTLSYITDDPIPPSDSAIGRPQIDEINKSRTQMIRQRERSLPIRWFDVNRVDPAIQYALMRGTWQGMIPVQGIGTNIIGEVARAGMPQENFVFDRIAKTDLNEFWQAGPGSFGRDIETRAEVDAAATSTDVRVARERAKVGKFFVGIAEVLGGLISIFEEPSSFGEGFTPFVSKTLSYSILADSTVLLDSNQRLKRLMQFVNFTAKSGWVDIESVLKEVATLSGLDPAVVIKPPKPRPPVEPNMSLRLTGIEDLLNPLALAFMMKAGQAPPIEMIEEAKKLIEASVTPPIPPPMEEGGQGPIGGAPSDLPMGPRPLNGPLPEPAPPAVGEANPNWSALNRVNQRVVSREGDE